MPKKKVKNYDNSLIGRYIRQIENPDSIGWNPLKRIWEEPSLPGYDKRNRGMGIDVENNAAAKSLVANRPGKTLTEEEERALRNEHIAYSLGALGRFNSSIPNFPSISPRKEAEAVGLIYRGDSRELKDPNTSLGRAYRSANEEDFHKAVTDYYRSVGVSERAKNNDIFWESQQKPGYFSTMASKIRGAMDKYSPSTVGEVRAEGGPISHWNDLSIQEKAAMMDVAIRNGITDLKDIRDKYNEFAEGGYKPSEKIKKRISNWEGAAMYKDTIDPLSGKMAKKNAPFETVTSGFVSVLPASIREQVLSNQELADNLFSYAYNVGPGRFRERVVPTLVKYYAGQATANDIAQSMWASGDAKLRGLRNRRAEERAGVLSALGANPVAAVPIPETTMPAFMPSNPQAFFNPIASYTPSEVVAPMETESPLATYDPEELKRREQAQYRNNFTTMMSLLYPQDNSMGLLSMLTNNSYSKGGGIHIDSSKKGTFTAAATKHGMGVQEFASKVLANKDDYSPAVVKKANFARNFGGKKHSYGGNLFDDGGDKDNIFKYTNSNGDVRYVYQDNPEDEEVPVRPLNTIFPDPAQWTFTDDAGKFYTPRRTTPTNTAELNPDNRTGFERALDNYVGEAFNTVPKGYHTLPAIGAAAFGLANPALGEAALTSGFGAHGLSKIINGEVKNTEDALMTALELAPLSRVARPVYEDVIQPGIRLFNSPLTGNWTKIGNREYRLSPNSLGANDAILESRELSPWIKELPLDEGRYYRQVGPDALDSYKANGVVSQFNKYGNNPTRYEVPMFTKGKPSLYREETKKYGDVWVVSKPGSNLEWESVKGAAVSPRYNGEFNSAPISEFEFYQYDPAKGYVKLDEGLNLPNGITFSRTPHIDYLKGLSEQQQIEYLTQNGLNDQWLWALKNNPDHLEGALSKAPIPNISTQQITAENAASITPEQWTAAQDAAIARGDMAEAQRLRDLHFKVSAPTPYISKGVYLPSGSQPTLSQADYYNGNSDLVTLYHSSVDADNLIKEGFDGVEHGLGRTKGEAKGTIFASANPDYAADYSNLYIQEGLSTPDKVGLMELKVPRGAGTYEGNEVRLRPEHIKEITKSAYEKTPWLRWLKTRKTDNFLYNIKSADAVTFGDNGIRIPLGSRDNFNINDIRYGLLPFLGLGTLGTLYGKQE